MNEDYRGPIWIDPRFWAQGRKWGTGDYWETVTTNTTQPVQPRVVPAPMDEERIRQIVREEIANLPIPFDVPDSLPGEREDR